MKVYFISLGCDKNLVDSEVMLGLLEQAGHTVTDEEDEAEAIVINTCCFIHDAKEESIETILQMAERKTSGVCKRLVVTGCLAQRYAEEIATEMGFNVHGGFTLNILNSVALKEYQSLGLCSATLSIELSFANAKSLVSNLKQNEIKLPVGMITYGYLPMMKFRSCPARTNSGCGNCNGHPQITDRMGEKFSIICREKQYSELLNFVPVYVGDKSIPKLDFEELYFTTESQARCKKIFEMYTAKAPADFERTAGLYFRELQ